MIKSVILAVNGHAFGGGFNRALAGDIRIASEKAKCSLSLGYIPHSQI
jgi:enoyl-CoA hydratase/carnithine racemase